MEENIIPKISAIICNNFFTIPKSDVNKKIGKIKSEVYEKIMKKIKQDVLDVNSN